MFNQVSSVPDGARRRLKLSFTASCKAGVRAGAGTEKLPLRVLPPLVQAALATDH